MKVFVVAPYYDFAAHYGEPEAVFSSRETAEVEARRLGREYRVIELDLDNTGENSK